MKLLFASTPAAGHLNPLLAIARMALARGDEAIVATGTSLRPMVEGAGARFLPLAPGADIDPSRVDEIWPERATLPPGPERLRFDFEHVFLDTMSPQAETMRAAIAEERPDVIVVDDFFFGATALFLDRVRARPPIIACSITVMVAARPDGAPPLLGLPPASDDIARARYAAIAADVDAAFAAPIQTYANAKPAAMDLPALPCAVLHSRHLMADAFLLSSVPSLRIRLRRAARPRAVRRPAATAAPARGPAA